jgi:hypothetical protein
MEWNKCNRFKTNRTFNVSGTAKPGEPYNNETDNYKQTHYQLFSTINSMLIGVLMLQHF